MWTTFWKDEAEIGKENVTDKQVITENKAAKNFPYTPKQLRELIHTQYEGCYNQQFKQGCLGRLQTKKCNTELGVLGGDFSERKNGGTSQWSIINRFDTNSRVKEEIQKIWMEETEGKEDFKTWIKDHAYDLFSNDGMYTDRLVKPNLGTIVIGKENESYAMKIIREIYNLKPEEEGKECKEGEEGDIKESKDNPEKTLADNTEEAPSHEPKTPKSEINSKMEKAANLEEAPEGNNKKPKAEVTAEDSEMSEAPDSKDHTKFKPEGTKNQGYNLR